MKRLKRFLVDAWGGRDDDFNWRKDQGPLDPSQVRSVLLLHLNEKLGDAVIDSLLVDAFWQTHPEIAVFVGTTLSYERYWRAHPHVADVALFPPSKGRSALGRIVPARRAARAWRGRFDVVVSFESFAQPDHFALLRALAPRWIVGFHKNRFRLFDYSLDEGRHGVMARPIFSKIASVMRVFGGEIAPESLGFHTPFGAEDELRIEPILARLPGTGMRVYLHAHGTGEAKRLSPGKVLELVEELRAQDESLRIWVGVPEDRGGDYESALSGKANVTVLPPLPDAFALFAFVGRMDLVVAPDTSVGHIAAALRKPQIVLFAGETNVPRVWKPLNDRCAVLVAPPGEPVEAIARDAFAVAVREAMVWAQGEKASL